MNASPTLLALETATEACSAALLHEGKLLERYQVAPRRHAELILPMVQSVLEEARLTLSQLDAIAFGAGPGAFTGVRIAVAVAQGLALGSSLKLLPVSSLAALALQAARTRHATKVLAAFDARMGEVYVGAYQFDAADRPGTLFERVCKPYHADPLAGAGWSAIGTGFSAADGALAKHYGAALAHVEAHAYPRAAQVAQLAAHSYCEGKAIPAADARPTYLRNEVTAIPATR